MFGRTGAIAVVIALSMPAGAAAQVPPSIGPLAGPAGCVTADASPVPGQTARDCIKARALHIASRLAFAPDERHLYVTSLRGAVVTLTRAADTGQLSFAGCVSDTGDDGRTGTEGFCADGDSLAGASDLAITPDGRFAYVLGEYSQGIAWLERDAVTGSLTPRGCMKYLPRDGRCGASPWLETPTAIALSPDGRHLYVSAAGDASLSWFARDVESGSLAYGGCISDSGSDGRCVNTTALNDVARLVFAPDGATLYTVGSGFAQRWNTSASAVTALTRDPVTGALALRACTLFDAAAGGTCTPFPLASAGSGLAVTADGSQLLMASREGSSLNVLAPDSLALRGCLSHQDAQGDDREQVDEEESDEEEPEDRARGAQASTCQPTRALGGVTAVAVSRDGRAVYASGNYLSAIRRDPATGGLEPFACVESYPQYKACQEIATGSLGDIVTTADGRNVYAISEAGVTVLAASVAVLNRTARLSRSGRIGVRLGCPATRIRSCRGTVGRSRYRVARGATATVRVKLAARQRALVRKRGRATIAIAARDADRVVRAAGRRVLVSAR